MGIFDLILKGGHVIDPAQDLDAISDVAVQSGRIAAIASEIPVEQSKQILDVRGHLILPGLIDTHAHVYQHVTGRFGLNADMVGVQSGVTTVVDQGGASCMTFPGFRHFIAAPAATRVLAFISAYVVGGLEGHYYPDLYTPAGVDVEATARAARANADLVKGIKAHAEVGGFSRWGLEVVRSAKAISRAADLPLYLHLGQLWSLPATGSSYDPDRILPEVVELLEPGDILAHPFTRHPGGFVNHEGKVHPIVQEALEQGIRVDVGYGSHFSFTMARQVLEAGILPHTLGADMHGYNTCVPVPQGTPVDHPDDEMHPFAGQARFSLVHALNSLLALGIPLKTLVPMVTQQAAVLLRMEAEIGSLHPGREADVTVLSDQRGRWILRDNEATEVMTERLLQPVFCLRAGEQFMATAPILPEVEVPA
jgi:dihydroorotase